MNNMVKYVAIFGAMIVLGVGATAATADPFDSIRRELAELKADTVKSELELAALDREVETTTKHIIRIYQNIEEQEAALVEQKRLLGARIQVVYKSYDHLVLSIFLDARDMGDLWRRFAFLARVNRADRQLVAANKFRAQKVKELRAELAEKKNMQLALKRRKQEEYAAITSAYNAKKAALESKIRDVQAWQAKMASMRKQVLTAGQEGLPNRSAKLGN